VLEATPKPYPAGTPDATTGAPPHVARGVTTAGGGTGVEDTPNRHDHGVWQGWGAELAPS